MSPSFSKDQLRQLLQATKLSFHEAELDYLASMHDHTDQQVLVAFNLYTSRIIQEALGQHAGALVRSAEASDRHAKSLTLATWVLAAATIVLAMATIALLLKA